MTRLACQILLVILAGTSISLSESVGPVDDPVKTAKQLVSSIVTAKSSSGLYMASGNNLPQRIHGRDDASPRFSQGRELVD